MRAEGILPNEMDEQEIQGKKKNAFLHNVELTYRSDFGSG